MLYALYATQVCNTFALMVIAAGYAEMPVRTYQTKWHHIPEGI